MQVTDLGLESRGAVKASKPFNFTVGPVRVSIAEVLRFGFSTLLPVVSFDHVGICHPDFTVAAILLDFSPKPTVNSFCSPDH